MPPVRSLRPSSSIDTITNIPSTILVVEDEPMVRATTAAMLKHLGYGVREAPDVRTALVALVDPDVDLLLTDICLSDDTYGYELAEKARLMRPDLKVVYMTGFGDPGTEAGLQAIQDHFVLLKPFTVQELSRKIDVALHSA